MGLETCKCSWVLAVREPFDNKARSLGVSVSHR